MFTLDWGIPSSLTCSFGIIPELNIKFGVKKTITSLHRMVQNLFRYLEPRIGVDHQCDGQTDGTAFSNNSL